MFSLDNTYSQGEVRSFVTRVQKLLPAPNARLDGRAED